MIITDDIDVGSGISVNGQNYVGLFHIAGDYWLASKEGDSIPAAVYFVKIDSEEVI